MEATSTAALTEHRDCVVQAACNVVKTTCNADLTETTPGDEQGDTILAVISLMGDLEWSIMLGLPSETAEKMTGAFAGFPIPFDSDDMGDAIGELTNIFAGEVKALLDTKGVHVEISLPSVMRASDLQVVRQKNSPCESIWFESPMGICWTGVAVGNSNG